MLSRLAGLALQHFFTHHRDPRIGSFWPIAPLLILACKNQQDYSMAGLSIRADFFLRFFERAQKDGVGTFELRGPVSFILAL
jgi:hypothetical protein